MKLKGINPFEQHVEKLVLGLVSVVFLGVLAMQFLYSPNQVDIGGGKRVPPQNIYVELGREADQLLGQIEDPDPQPPEMEVPQLAAEFDAKLNGSTMVEPRRVAALGRGVEIEIPDAVGGTGPVMPMRVPATAQPVVAGHWGTLDPYFIEEYPEYLEYTLRDAQPYDLPSLSVEAVLSGTELAEMLRSADEGRRPIPAGWWSGGLEVLTVEVERSERAPGGMWTAPEPLDRPEWVEDPFEILTEGRPELNELADFTPADVAEWASLVRDEPELSVKPPFAPMIAGLEWVPPSEASDLSAKIERRDRIDQIKREIEQADERIASIEDRQQSRDNNQRTRTPDDPGGRTGTRPGARNPGTTQTDRPDRTQLQIDRINERILELEEELDELLLEEEGADTDADPQGSRYSDYIPLVEQEEFRIYAHDLKVRPGYEYRYRVRVAVNNPLFGRERTVGDSDPELAAQAREPMVFSGWSEWSQETPVDQPFYYFVNSASESGQLGKASSSAAVEVFQVYYGFYRKSSDNLEPGSPVSALFTLPSGLYTFDLEAVVPAQLAAFFETEEEDVRRQGRRPQQGGRPGQRGPMPIWDPTSDDPRRPGTRDDPRARQDDPDDPQVADLEEGEVPEGLDEVEQRLPIPVDAVLLDVAMMPDVTPGDSSGGGGKSWYRAYFFSPTAGLVERSTIRTDAETDAYARLELSARAGRGSKLRAPQPIEVP